MVKISQTLVFTCDLCGVDQSVTRNEEHLTIYEIRLHIIRPNMPETGSLSLGLCSGCAEKNLGFIKKMTETK